MPRPDDEVLQEKVDQHFFAEDLREEKMIEYTLVMVEIDQQWTALEEKRRSIP
jgi:hypothetical protein